MVSELYFYQLALITLVWLCLMLHWAWPSDRAIAQPTPPQPAPPRRKRSREPTPFVGLTTKPHCDACEHASAPYPRAPSAPPPRLVMTRGRCRQIDTSHHFCPNPDCAYRGWTGWGNLRANGHPSGGPWRQLLCIACRGSFLETLGTLFHGKRSSVDLIVRIIACLAEGLGIRGTARVFEVDPNTILQWLVEAAAQLRGFSRHGLHDVRVGQVQLDELFALLSAVKDGEVSEAEAVERLERSPQWVWVAMDPESKLLLTIDVGNRTLAMAQRFVHQVAQVLAPDCAPLFLTDGFREYLTALLTHYGQWVQPPRCQATGPTPKPRWMPLSQLLYAQVVKTVRRGAWSTSNTASCLAPWRPSITCSPPWVGTSTRPLWSGSTSASASMSPPSGDGSPRCARAKTGCGSSWPCITCTIISACLTPAYVSRCHSLYPYSDICRTWSSTTKGYGCVKHFFPLSLAPGKPRFYMGKFGQHTKVTL